MPSRSPTCSRRSSKRAVCCRDVRPAGTSPLILTRSRPHGGAAKLGPAVESGRVVLSGDESTKQVDHIPDGSLDVVFGFNLVYFLSPLTDYLEIYSAKLKPGGKMVFGCKEAAKSA